MSIIDNLLVAGATAVVAFSGWIVRSVFTNNKKIEVLASALEQSNENSKTHREEMKKDLHEVKRDVKDMSTTVADFIGRQEERNNFYDNRRDEING